MTKWLHRLNLALASALAALLVSADADSGNSDSGGSDSGNSGSEGAESSAESGVETSSNSLTYGDTTMSIALSDSSSGREPIQNTARVRKEGEHTGELTGDDLREIPPQ